jgi:hypothetical protein
MGETQPRRGPPREGRGKVDDPPAGAATAFANATHRTRQFDYKLALSQPYRAWAEWQRDPGVDPVRPPGADSTCAAGTAPAPRLAGCAGRAAAYGCAGAQLDGTRTASAAGVERSQDIAALAVNPALPAVGGPLQQAQQLAATHSAVPTITTSRGPSRTDRFVRTASLERRSAVTDAMSPLVPSGSGPTASCVA